MKNCDTCKYCLDDFSVGVRDCLNNDDGWTDIEITLYYEDEIDGCPYWEQSELIDYECYLQKGE